MGKIAEKHGGLLLPVANETAASNVVRNKLKNIWQQLKPKVYVSSLELDLYLFIRTIYPEDFRIPIEDLVACGMDIKLIEHVRHHVMRARGRVDELIDNINRRKNFQLHSMKDGYNNKYLKMSSVHLRSLDRTRRLASEIVFESLSENYFPIKNRYENCYGLSIEVKVINEHTADWKYPKLAFLLLKYRAKNSQAVLPVNFFKGMKKLRVLSLDVSSFPDSIGMLMNLRALRLQVLRLKDMSWIGGLVSIEFLTIIISTSCLVHIPKEMGHLRNLRLLDLSQMNLSYIPPGVFSRLLKLEELYLPLSFTSWGSREIQEEETDDDCGGELERINASVDEISTLSLIALQIFIPNASMMWNKSAIINERIERFKIFVLNKLNFQLFGNKSTTTSTNELQLTGDAHDIKESGISDLIHKTEHLSLIRVRNLKNIMYQLLEDSKFLQLKKMIITECDELEYLVYTLANDHPLPDSLFVELRCLHMSMLTNLKGIWNGTSRSLRFRWFLNLEEIKIRFCHKLKYVFPLSIGRGLIRLKAIEILDCNELEGIFYQNKVDYDDSTTNGIYFVEELYLYSLPRFVGFLLQRDLGGGDANSGISSSSEVSLMEMHCAFSPELMNERLIKLKKLKIAFCDALRVIFCFEENHGTSSIGVLNSLEELELCGLRNLKHIWFKIPQNITAFQRLRLLILTKCRNLYLLMTFPIAKLLVQLQKIQVSRCDQMEEIIAVEDEKDHKNALVFPKLKALELQYMPNLETFSSAIHAMELPSLEFFKLNQCNKMEVFSYGSLNTPMLKKLELDGSLYSLIGDLNATLTRLKAETF